MTCLFHLKNNFFKKLAQIGLKNHSKELNALFTTINGLLFLNLRCVTQFSMANTFLDNIISEIDFLLTKPQERTKFLEFLHYLKNNYFNIEHRYFLGKISNFQDELLGDWYPQLSNNVSESLNSVLNSVFNRGFVNRGACVEGLKIFYSNRRDKYRVFMNDEKRNKRKKSDILRFTNLKFISIRLLELLSNPNFVHYPNFLSSCFFEAIFKFSRVDDPNVNEIFSGTFSSPNYQPQIIIPM